MNLERQNSFTISTYYLLAYAVNSINRRLEDLTITLVSRLPKKPYETPKISLFSIFDKL